MADRVLPPLLVLTVVRKTLHDELVDTAQRDLRVPFTEKYY